MESWRLNSANSRSQVQSSTSDDDDDGPPPLVDDSDSDDSHSHRSPFDNDYDCLPPLIDDSDSDDLQDDEIFSISASNAQARPRDGLRSIVEIMQVYYGAIRDVYGSSDDDDDDPPPLVDDSAFSDSEGHQRLLHHTESHIPYPLDRLRLSMVGNNFPHLMDFKRASREAVRNLPRFTMTPTISCDSSDASQEDQTITPTTMSTTTGNNFKGSDSDCDGAHDTWKDFCALCLSKVIEGEQFTKLPCGHIFHIRPGTLFCPPLPLHFPRYSMQFDADGKHETMLTIFNVRR